VYQIVRTRIKLSDRASNYRLAHQIVRYEWNTIETSNQIPNAMNGGDKTKQFLHAAKMVLN